MEEKNVKTSAGINPAAEREKDTKFKNKNKKKNSGAKVVKKVLCAGALVGILATGGYVAAKGGLNLSWLTNLTGTKDSKLANSLVTEYTEDGIFRTPDSVIINRSYDIKYCDGEVLSDAIVSSSVKYCEIYDEYYTSDGHDIAIVTLEGEKIEVVEAIEVDLDGVTIYMPPAGYELEGNKAVRTVTETVTKVVPKSATGDYSNVSIEGVRDYSIVSVEEKSTKTYSEMQDMVLIVDVPDNAVLTNNQCEGSFNLVPRIR